MSEPTKQEQIREWIEEAGDQCSAAQARFGGAAVAKRIAYEYMPRALAALELASRAVEQTSALPPVAGSIAYGYYMRTTTANILAILQGKREEPGDGEG
ncbi:hypothetical protein LCGC14_2131150 [marine sediment metagenome]|uniref:Uncharacterized protein n=1 Tax=marine sediment metagenome TaxID=412755 RepID=A0A0F9E1F2_9ZZZZ